MSGDPVRIDVDRLLARLRRLGEVGATPEGGVSRLALSDADREGRDLVVGWMREAGLDVHIDRIGNVVGVWETGAEGLVLTGSHIDTVTNGGLYDGNLGVLAGLGAIEALQAAGFRPRTSLGVAFFTNEEGARFPPDMLGSLVFAREMSVDEGGEARGVDGSTLADELDRCGYRGQADFPVERVRAFVELHIEQGPVLEAAQVDIGVVQGVQGICWLEIEFRGESRHAGTTPMALRRDAGAAALALAAEVARLPAQRGGGQLATVGRMVLEPNLVNVVARRAVMTVDLRNTDGEVLRAAAADLARQAVAVAAAHGVEAQVRTLVDLEPVSFHGDIVETVREVARAHDLRTLDLPSGAGHDAQILARICPAGMIFVPSVGGVSHNPREHTEPGQIAAGADVLLGVLQRLAG